MDAKDLEEQTYFPKFAVCFADFVSFIGEVLIFMLIPATLQLPFNWDDELLWDQQTLTSL